MNPSQRLRSAATKGLAVLCADHLHAEEALLNSGLPLVRALLAAFSARGFEAFAAALRTSSDFTRVVEEINTRRREFREEVGRRVSLPGAFSLTRVLATLTAADQAAVAHVAARVRGLAHELAEVNFRVSVHLRVYLDAYRRILRDVTNTATSAGRYGPAGVTLAVDYRPLVLLRG